MAQQTSSSSSSSLLCLDTVDDFYFSVVSDDETDPNVPVSDVKYAEALQFQETLLSSLITSQQNPSSSKTVDEDLLFNETLMASSSMLQPPFLCVASSSKSLITTQQNPSSSKTVDEDLLFNETLMASSSTLQPPLLCVASSSKSLITSQQKPSSSKTVDEDLLFNETLMASSSTLQPPLLCVASSSKSVHAVLTEEEADDELSSMIICEICAEPKTTDEMFRNQICYHSFCSECVVKQVSTKIQDNITNVSCPGLNCKGLLELGSCRSLLPKELIDRWDDALCEALLLTVPKFYCPFKDCSAMLLDENEGVEDIRESECPFCHRLFCASCHVTWHPGIGCEEYQKLNVDERGREDLLVRELANQKKWKRCPRCRFYVEKRDGCLHMTCRCKFEFCYACGETWTTTHGGCQRN